MDVNEIVGKGGNTELGSIVRMARADFRSDLK